MKFVTFLLFIVICSFSGQLRYHKQLDGPVLAFEVTNDSTHLNYWRINAKDFPIKGFWIYDTISNSIDYDKGFYVFYSTSINASTVDQIKYFGMVANKDSSDDVWNDIQDSTKRIIENKRCASNKITRTTKSNLASKRLLKRYNSVKIRNKLGLIELPKSNLNHLKQVFYLFRCSIGADKSATQYGDRILLDRNKLGIITSKTIKVKYFVIREMSNLKEFKPKFNALNY